MRSLRTLACSLLAALLAAPAGARDLWTRDWIEVRTRHFSVASALGEKDTLQVASDLESFRAAVRTLLRIRVEERVPTRVFLVPPRTAQLGVTRDQIGWFRPEMRQNVAVVSPGPRGLSLSVVLFHEYAHFLAHNAGSATFPPWFDEGFAEVLATMRFERGHAFVGDLVRQRREWLQFNPWMSYSRVLKVREVAKLRDGDRAMFYAQSWALVHFLMLGPHRPNFGKGLAAYLAAVEAGEPDDAAFEQAFGEKPEQLSKRVLKYLQGEAKIWPIALAKDAQDAAPVVRSLALDDIAARLGTVALVSAELDVADEAFEAALAANPQNVMALSGAADLHKFAGRFDAAEPLYQRAIALEPSNPLPLLDYGEYFFDRARTIWESDPEQAAAWIAEARRQFARSYKLADDIPETLAMNGATYFGEREGAERALASLEAAHAMLPSQPQIKFLLAQAYAQAERNPDAARLVRSLVAWGHAGASGEVTALLQQLEREATPDSETSTPGANESGPDAAEATDF